MNTAQLISLCSCFAICFAACGFVLIPLTRTLKSSDDEHDTFDEVSLKDQRERCLQVLRDLDLDRDTGKISIDDYHQMRASVGQELITIVDNLSKK